MFSTSHCLLPLGTLLIVGSTLVFAQDKRPGTPTDVYNLSLAELGQVEISIATGNSTPLDRAPATASVIYADEITAMGARDLDDVLETVPGLHISLSSLSRLDSIYSIRGIHTGFNPQVLLLLNGIPLQSSTQGGRPTLFRLPVSSIDRVEVIRGPGSAIYGADAYSGVINVITKDAAAINGTEVGGRTGSFGTRDLWLQSATSWQDWGIAFSLAYQESDGDNQRVIHADLQSALDSVYGTRVSEAPHALSTRYHVLDTHLAANNEKFQVNVWSWLSTDAGVGAGGAQALDMTGRDDGNLWLADLTYHLEDSSTVWAHSIHTSYLYYDQEARFDLLPAGTVLPIGSDGNLDFSTPAGTVRFPQGLIGNPVATSTDGQLGFISIFTGWDSHRLRFAAGTRHQALDTRERKNFGPGVIDGIVPVVGGRLTDVSNTPYVFLADSSRTIRYLSLQDEWQIAAGLALTAGLRYDDYSDFGNTTNPRVALVWAGSEQFTTKLLYGSAFRAPSFAEQRFKNNPVSLGNPTLSPEHIDTWELSLNHRFSESLQSTLTLFSYQAEDMIEFMADPAATTKTAQNARDQQGDGFEWEFNWKPVPQMYFTGSYSWQDARDSDSNTKVADAAGQQFKVNANWEFYPDWLLNGQINRVGDRHRAAADTRPAVKDYTLLNFTVRRNNILPNLDISLALRNATDEDAREPSSGSIAEDYPLETRSAWLELNYVFN